MAPPRSMISPGCWRIAARELGLEIEMRQTNHEGMLVDWLHEAQAEGARAVLLNAGGPIRTPRSRCWMRCRATGPR